LRQIQNWRGYVPAEEIGALANSVSDVPVANAIVELPDRGDVRGKPNVDQIRVCMGLACVLAGSESLCGAIAAITARPVIRETCMARCWMAPVLTTEDGITGFNDGSSVDSSCAGAIGSDDEAIAAYMTTGGYGVLKSCFLKRRSVDSVFSALSAFQLALFEGARFPIGARMRELCDDGLPAKILLLIDEAPPGIMSNAYYIERNTHSVIEGLLIMAFAIKAPQILVHYNCRYISLRGKIERELGAARRYGFLEHVDFVFSEFSSETQHDDADLLKRLCRSSSQAEIEDIEPKEQSPLEPVPVLLVGTDLLRWIPDLVSKGIECFCGDDGDSKTTPMLYSVAGRVVLPGVYKAAAGRTIHELIEMAGGIKDGYDFDSFIAGEWSNSALPAHLASVRIFREPGKSNFPGQSMPIVIISSHDHIARACSFRSHYSNGDHGNKTGRTRKKNKNSSEL
jgi:NADH:ubiquinone oxidoreductase subunit F (NADH-binding)